VRRTKAFPSSGIGFPHQARPIVPDTVNLSLLEVSVSKIRVKIKLQGFEMEVEGSRDDMVVVREAVTQQMSGLLGPAADIAAGEATKQTHNGHAPITIEAVKSTAKKKFTRAGTNSAETVSGTPVEWRHDASKFGSPKQEWAGTDKAIWLLYVAASAATVSEMSTSTIIATLYKLFRSVKAPRASNLARDLAKLQQARNGHQPLVSLDATKDPGVWYLTDAGIKHAQTLVAAALGAEVSV
jgi:hypothetical protein